MRYNPIRNWKPHFENCVTFWFTVLINKVQTFARFQRLLRSDAYGLLLSIQKHNLFPHSEHARIVDPQIMYTDHFQSNRGVMRVANLSEHLCLRSKLFEVYRDSTSVDYGLLTVSLSLRTDITLYIMDISPMKLQTLEELMRLNNFGQGAYNISALRVSKLRSVKVKHFTSVVFNKLCTISVRVHQKML